MTMRRAFRAGRGSVVPWCGVITGMQPVVLLMSCRGLRRVTARWRDACGQTTTEWLMIAGLLTAVGIFLQALMSSTLWKYSHQLIYGLRTIAP